MREEQFTHILEADNAVFHYEGKAALSGVSLKADAGEVIALMGPNGSGKTTFIKAVAGLLHLTKGTIRVCGRKAGMRTRSLISFLPDRNIMRRSMSAQDAASFYADFFSDFNMAKAKELMDFMHIERDMEIGKMSKGMVERLNIALCFSRRAMLYLLDEPLGGVDPLAREQIVSSLKHIMRPDAAVIVSTHIARDIEGMFSHLCFIDKGRVILFGNTEDVKKDSKMSIEDLYLATFRGRE